MDIKSTNIWMYVSSFNEEVTGSNTYIQINWSDGREVKFVSDCGLFQEKKWLGYNSEKFPYAPEEIDFAIATHMHIDHIGRFPYLMTQGFKGDIYTTPETKAMFPKMLNDTADHLLADYVHDMAIWRKERKARSNKNSTGKKNKPRRENTTKLKKKKKNRFMSKDILYDKPVLIFEKSDVRKLQAQVVAKEYFETFSPAPNVKVTFYPNGHMLGASIVVITATYNEEQLNVLITGDYAKKNKVTALESYVPENVLRSIDMVISESTYGLAPPVRNITPDYEKHLKLLTDALVNGKKMVYMTNSIERPVVILRELQYIMANEKIGEKLAKMPIYFDSTFGTTGLAMYEKILGKNALNIPENLVIISHDDRPSVIEKLRSPEPMLLFLTSPQLTQGSIQMYAKYILPNPNINMLFCSYVPECVSNTINLPKGTKILYNNEPLFKRCYMEKVGHFSSHATISELKELIDKCENKNTILFLHGTNGAKENMVNNFDSDTVTAYAMLRGKTVRLNRFGITKVY